MSTVDERITGNGHTVEHDIIMMLDMIYEMVDAARDGKPVDEVEAMIDTFARYVTVAFADPPSRP